MPEYIDVQIDTDPLDVLNDFVLFMQALIPGWQPSPGQLDFWLAQTMSIAGAESRDVASAVPKSIFRWFGATLLNFPPIDDTPASVLSTWTMVNNAGYTIPAGTQVSIARTGDEVYAFETQVDVVVPPLSTTATNVQLIATVPGAAASGLGTIGSAVQLLDPLSFVTSITQAATTTGGVDAEDDDTYLNRLATFLQLLAPRPIVPVDFAVFAKNIVGVQRAVAIDGYNPLHNLLTLNQASAETDASGYASLANTTPASSAVQAADGAKSVTLTATAGADQVAATPVSAATGVAVTPGDIITALGSIRAFSTVRSCAVGIQWLDAANAQISIVYGTAANDSNAAWTNYTVTASAPALAVRARVVFKIIASAAAEVHYVDRASIRRGAGTDWVPGGTGETGQPRTVSVIGIDSNGNALDAGHKASVLADLQARREVNFVIFVLDPQSSIIDVTYQVKALPGYDLPTLVTAINAALATGLNPAVWGVPAGDPTGWANQTVVRYLEIAQIINQVAGVDYITTTAGDMDLQIGFYGGSLVRADLTLPGIAPLPTTVGGTLTGTAT